MARIAQIFRYPVKGLSPEPLRRVELVAGQGMPLDRAFAVAHGSTEYKPSEPQYLPPGKFLMLKRNEKLAALRTRYRENSGELVVERNGKQVARGRVDQPVGRKMLEQFFAAYLGPEVRGSPKLLRAEGHSFSDSPQQGVSLINVSSLRELERVMGRHIDPLRFRANIYFDTGTPWQEFDWCGRDIRIDGAAGRLQLRGTSRIERCAATNVNLETAERDLNIPLALQRAFGHADMGVYAEVVEGGTLSVGDSLETDAD